MLFIPYINYLFYIFQARGAYNSIKNYYQLNKKLPSPLRATIIAIKYSLYGSAISSFYHFIILLIGFNTFGDVAAWYTNWAGNIIAPLLDPLTAAYWFGDLPFLLERHGLSYNGSISFSGFISAVSFIGVSYLVFSVVGVFLALYNVKSDLKRNLMEASNI